MFKTGDIVKILIPNVVNSGYDYRLTADADLGTFVRVSVMNRPYIGVVYGVGDFPNIYQLRIYSGFKKCLRGH